MTLSYYSNHPFHHGLMPPDNPATSVWNSGGSANLYCKSNFQSCLPCRNGGEQIAFTCGCPVVPAQSLAQLACPQDCGHKESPYCTPYTQSYPTIHVELPRHRPLILRYLVAPEMALRQYFCTCVVSNVLHTDFSPGMSFPGRQGLTPRHHCYCIHIGP